MIDWDELRENGYTKQTAYDMCPAAGKPGFWRVYDRKEALLAETDDRATILAYLEERK